MTYNEIIQRFDIKKRSGDSVQAICPAHKDNKASLTISKGKDGRTLLYCHAGCSTSEILAAAGLSLADLFEDDKKTSWIRYVEELKGGRVEAVYNYFNLSGKYVYTHLRLSGKEFPFGIIKGDQFYFGLMGKSRRDLAGIYGNYKQLIEAIKNRNTIYITEGEKDANTLISRGYAAFTCGSAGDYVPGLDKFLKGCNVVVLADNDKPGIDSANKIAAALKGSAGSVKVITPVPEEDHADISDYFKNHTKEDFYNLVTHTPIYTAPDPQQDPDADNLCKASAIQKKQISWLIPGYIPKNEITIIAGDGGSGKTSIVCDIAAAITSGDQSILTRDIIPADFGKTEPGNVLFLSGEDSFSYVLNDRLENAGADLDRVYTVQIEEDNFRFLKFDSPKLEDYIKRSGAKLVIFDPLQQFLPRDVDMSKRNEMRQSLSILTGYGKKYDATILIVCHSNKQSNNSGRKRIADSADIWDISRSVLIAGDTGEDHTKYLSHEKSNYSELQQTILYDLDGKRVLFRGRTEKRDADFVRKDKPGRAAPARREAKELIIKTLEENNGKMDSSVLDKELILNNGVSIGTLKRAKADLKADNVINYYKSSFNDVWRVELLL